MWGTCTQHTHNSPDGNLFFFLGWGESWSRSSRSFKIWFVVDMRCYIISLSGCLKFPVVIWHHQFDAWRQTMAWMKIKIFKLMFVEIQKFVFVISSNVDAQNLNDIKKIYIVMYKVAVATCCTRGPHGHTSCQLYILTRSERKGTLSQTKAKISRQRKCGWSSYCLCRKMLTKRKALQGS